VSFLPYNSHHAFCFLAEVDTLAPRATAMLAQAERGEGGGNAFAAMNDRCVLYIFIY